LAGGHYVDVPTFDEVYHRNGRIYVPFHNILVAAGPFLPPSFDCIEQHLELPPEHEFSHNIRGRNRYLSAARVCGDSMMFRDIYDGDIVIFQRSGFEYIENGRIVVIEKVGEEEGFGAWSLKRLVIEQPRSSTRNEFGEKIDEDNPVVVLYSYNPQVRPWQLDPSGRYHIRGVLRRSLRPEDARLVDSEGIRPTTPDRDE
jgi:SOS-response transcriptional repressor LexA